MSHTLCRALILTTLLVGGPALAQDTATVPPPPSDPNQAIWSEPEILVIGRLRGPAMWKLTSGDSTVYILGSMPVMKKRYGWDQGRVSFILKNAHIYLSKPEAKANPMLVMSLAASRNLGFGKTLDSVLPGDLNRRFNKLVTSYGLNPKSYAKSRPLWAVLQLRHDVYDKAELTTTEPEKTIARMAKARNTPTKPVAVYNVDAYLKRVNNFSRAEEMSCVANMLSEIEFSTRYAKTATDAWAQADIATVRAYMVNSASDACLEGQSSTALALNRMVDDNVKAIEANLKTPGKSIVVMPLGALLRKDGALERLRAKGIEISDPEGEATPAPTR